ncbi:MAG: hypothetical protein PQJ49_01955 [Sphaerochaetaceae bacterium]|nr:hypothetical protein [Sphaerochaetaceae bacterium]
MSNLDKYSSGQVIKKVNNEVSIDFNQYDHSCLYYLFSVHPYGYEKKNIEYTKLIIITVYMMNHIKIMFFICHGLNS